MRDPTAETALRNLLRDERRKVRRARGKLTPSETQALREAKRMIELLEKL